MKVRADNPRIYIPPPLIYLAIFFMGMGMKSLAPIDKAFLDSPGSKIIGCIIITIGIFFFGLRAVKQFFLTRNTVETFKPAKSLQTTGVYSVSRNPMYTGLSLVYLGYSFVVANWWYFILFPLLIFIMQVYVISREEKYLERKFGQAYLDYKKRVRRWV